MEVAGNVFGYLGGLLTISSSLFQLKETRRTQSAQNVSIGMFVTLMAGQSLWIVNGVLLNNMPVIMWNSVGVAVLATTVWYIRRILSKNTPK